MPKTIKIVIAEDDTNISDLLKHVLAGDGYEVHAAEDGEAGLELVKKIHPDLLITDVMMPRRNGYQLVHSILNDFQDLPTPKIIILTSRTDSADIKKGLTVGADMYIAKPFDVHEVLHLVEELLSQKPG